MARILVVAGTVFSVRAAAFEMARRLGDDGHRVSVVTPPGGGPSDRTPPADGVDVRTVTVRRAVGTKPGARDGDERGTDTGARPSLRWLDKIAGIRATRRRAVDGLHADEVVAAAVDLDADLVLVDTELPSVVISLLAEWREVAVFTTFPGLHRDLGTPPTHTGVVPGRGASGTRIGIAATWLRYLVRTEARSVQQWLTGPFDSERARLRRLARRLRLPRGTVDGRQWVRPVGFPGLPVIEFNLAEFDLPRRQRPTTYLVGSMVEPATDGGDPDDLDDLDDDMRSALGRIDRARADGRRIVLCSLGSFASSYRPELLRSVVDAAATEPGWQLVLSLGATSGVPDGVDLGDDVVTLGWGPQAPVLRRTDVAIVHGGHATVYECIEHAVPMVVAPMTLDQPGYGARVVHHALGVVVDADEVSPVDVRAAVRSVLADESVAGRAAEMAAAAHRARRGRLLQSAVSDILGARSPARLDPPGAG